MNGMTMAISKPCCPMYNFGTSNRTSLIPRRLSNLPHQGQGISFSPLVATSTRMLKHHHVYSSSSAPKAAMGDPKCEGPKRDILLNFLLTLGIFSMAFAKACEAVSQPISTIGGITGILKSNARHFIFLGVASAFVAIRVLDKFMSLPKALNHKLIKIGDILQVGSLKGEVTKLGFVTTSLCGPSNVPIVVPNFLISKEGVVNKSSAAKCSMVSYIYVPDDDNEKVSMIKEEIVKMMKSCSNVYLDEEQPYCKQYRAGKSCTELALGCDLKPMCEDELKLVKRDLLLQSAQIVKKHGARLGEHLRK